MIVMLILLQHFALFYFLLNIIILYIELSYPHIRYFRKQQYKFLIKFATATLLFGIVFVLKDLWSDYR